MKVFSANTQPGIIQAPFTAEQVVGLNRYQQLPFVQHYHCGRETCRAKLTAHASGLYCHSCRYFMQTFAHVGPDDYVKIDAARRWSQSFDTTRPLDSVVCVD